MQLTDRDAAQINPKSFNDVCTQSQQNEQDDQHTQTLDDDAVHKFESETQTEEMRSQNPAEEEHQRKISELSLELSALQAQIKQMAEKELLQEQLAELKVASAQTQQISWQEEQI